MHDHWWWRPGWRVGRRFYSVFATFEDHPELHELVDTWQQDLSGIDGLDMIPREWRHLTIQGIGFADEVTNTELDAIHGELTRRLADIESPTVTFGPLAIHPEALVLPAIPQEPLTAIKTAIRDGIATVLGADRVDGPADGFRPHVTVAYNTLERSSSMIEPPASAVRATNAVVTMADVKLLKVHRDQRMYEWQEVASLPLGR